MHTETNAGRLAQWRERRRAAREDANALARRRQEQIDELLAEYPVDPSQRARTNRSGWDGFGGGFWLGSGGGDGDCADGGDGGFWSGLLGGDWGGGDWGGGDGGGC